MKKIMKPFVLVAAAAMALASCQKNEIPAPEKQDVHFTINAGIETKTSIVESEDKDENGKPIYHAQWDGNEELGVLFAAPKAETTASDVVRLTNAVSGRTASFQGNVTLDETSTSTFYAFYPAAAFYRGYGEGDARLDLKNVQNPTATSFDPLCDILVAKPYEYEVVEGKVVADGLEFARLMSVLRIDLKSEFADIQNEFVESVSFTAGDVEITGYARVFLDNPKFDKWASNGAQWCTVTANYDSDLVSINGTSNSVYLVIAPVTIPANKDLTFEIKTKNYNISKTIKSPEMKFTAGKVSKINLTIVADNCDKIDTSIDYSGEYLIVNTDLTKAASKWADGNNLPAVDLNTIDGIVYESDNLADCKMNITKVTEGENAGKYTIKDAAGKYLYAASSSKNQLKGKDEESYWTIIEGDGKYIMTSHSQETRNILRYNGENTPPIFSCYSSGQSDVTLYKYSDIKPDTTPKFVKVTTTPADWSGTYLIVCETQDVAFNGSLTTLDATNNVVSVTIQNGEIEYSDALNSSTFVVAKNGESYTIQSASGYYIGRDAASNGLNANTSTKYTNTITLNSGNTTIAGNGGLKLRYNKNSDQTRFRYYTSAQTEIQLYKLVGGETPEPDEPETPEAVTLKSIAVSGQKTAYNVGDAFVKPTVTATYSDESTKTVTDAAVFNGYNLSAAGTQTVTVQYTEDGVTVTATYTITVSPKATEPEQPEEPETTPKFVKVTSAPSDWSGTYLIVWSDIKARSKVNSKDLVSVSNSVLSISNNEIVADSNTAKDQVVITAKSGGYTIQLSDGQYLYVTNANQVNAGVSSKASTMSLKWTSSGVEITGVDSANNTRYLYQNGTYYRMYKKNTSYNLPTLYKLQ